MKTGVKILTMLLFGAIILGIYSCDKKGDLVGSPTLIISPATLSGPAGSTVVIAVGANQNTSTKSALKKISVTILDNAGQKVATGHPDFATDSTISGAAVQFNFAFKIPTGAATGSTYTLNFTVNDNGVGSAIGHCDVTVSAAPELLEFNNITLGGQYNTSYGSFLSAIDGKVYFLDGAKNNSEKINMGLFFNGGSIFNLQGPNNLQSYETELMSWSVKNKTTFGDFDFIEPVSTWDSLKTSKSLENLYVKEIAVSADRLFVSSDRIGVIGFVTGTGKYGAIKLNSFDRTGEGKINVDIKIQR